MKRLQRYMGIAIVMCYASLAFPQDRMREQVINRREQASGAFLATPQGTYQHYCAHCHGEDAKGGGRLWTSELSPTPTDLTATSLDETALAKFIDEGSAAAGRSNLCPPWGNTISTPDITRLTRHLLSLNGKTTASPPAPTASLQSRHETFPFNLLAILIAETLIIAAILRRIRKQKIS
ncbi:MAG: cytochrome c [Candidatus Hydrogenedentes bacterium]|nr:cytochrome c [Candidatus Hydrogenedentota bacterium]